MSGYKKNAANNRDALFGGVADAPKSKSKKKSSSSSRADAPAPTIGTAPTTTTTTTSKGYKSKAPKKSAVPSLSGAARDAKLKEAADYREKANKCMDKGFFKKPDPVAASTYFKRAADCYQQAGEIRLERLFRIESANVNMQCGVWASAASDYTRAAELMLLGGDEDSNDGEALDPAQRRRDASELHKKAATAWTEMNEKAKAAASQVNASMALFHGVESTRLSKEALTGMEEAVEAHVPDPLNPYARYRQTGHSAYIDPDSDETVENCAAETKELAQSHVVTRSYAHEPVQDLVNLLTAFGEYASALYAAGAATVLLSQDGLSTLSLSRAYVTETILTLALGDPVAAEQAFLQRHVQKTFYLKSRECQLAEELFRAVKTRDADALDEARSITGPNRAALANLPSDNLRQVVQELRVSGVARKSVPESRATASSGGGSKKSDKPEKPLQDILSQKTGYEQEAAEGANLDGDALASELDNLDFALSDSDSDIGGAGGGADELDELEDDDIDLR